MTGHTDGSVLNDDSECPGRGSRTPAVRARSSLPARSRRKRRRPARMNSCRSLISILEYIHMHCEKMSKKLNCPHLDQCVENRARPGSLGVAGQRPRQPRAATAVRPHSLPRCATHGVIPSYGSMTQCGCQASLTVSESGCRMLEKPGLCPGRGPRWDYPEIRRRYTRRCTVQ